MSDRIVAKVYCTKNYDKFVPWGGNRGQKPVHMKTLSSSIDTRGWICSLPMSVRKAANGKLMILDGHNRFYAAKALGLPVNYTMVNGDVSDDDVFLINRTQLRWTMLDFVRSYAQEGNKEYQAILDFMDTHKVGVRVAASFLAYRQEACGKTIEAGNFKVVDLEWANIHVTFLKQLNAVASWSLYKSKFVRAFINACKLESFDPVRFVKQGIKQPHKLIDYGVQKDIYQMFEDIYNFGYSRKNKVPLAFQIRESTFPRTPNQKKK